MIKKREYEMLLTEEGHLDLNGLVTFDYFATFQRIEFIYDFASALSLLVVSTLVSIYFL